MTRVRYRRAYPSPLGTLALILAVVLFNLLLWAGLIIGVLFLVKWIVL